MHVELSELVELLRARNSNRTSQRAERSLPQHIDLDRDRELLRQCGIDPNVLAFILSVEDREAAPTEPHPQPSVGVCVAQEITTAHAMHEPESDDVLADLERAFRRPSGSRLARGSVIVTIVVLLLIASVVAVLT